MIVLGIDTSTDSLTVGLIDEKKVLSEYNLRKKLKHAAFLIPTIQKILKKTRTEVGEIDLFSVGLGPGSFTGLRVGVTTTRALAIALNKPIVGVPTMDAIAYNGLVYLKKAKLLDKDAKICPILDAKKRQIYACIYSCNGGKIIRKSNYLLEPVEMLVKRLEGLVLFLGDGVPLYKAQLINRKKFKALFLERKDWFPKAGIIASMALESYRDGRSDNPYDLVPLYLYARDCNVRYNGGGRQDTRTQPGLFIISTKVNQNWLIFLSTFYSALCYVKCSLL